jgi:DNA-binding LacI/PurR family transcriptional regulator
MSGIKDMSARPLAPVMKDVARLAGVSHQTVSRVLNGHPSVSPSARAQVEKAIGQLGYRRNTAARALVTRQSMTLGVVTVDTSHFGPANTLFGIERAARAAGYYVNFAVLRDIDAASMGSVLNHLIEASVDGIIFIAPVREARLTLRGLSTDVPMVTVDASEEGIHSGMVVDQVMGARLATRHLLELGHRRIVHVRGPQNWFEADSRERGWREELAAAPAVAADVVSGDWSAASGYAAGRRLAQRSDATAVFVANDQMALGLIRALSEAGRSVPDDVSVVGFDDIPEAAYLLPPLTTVRQDFAEVGRRSIERLLTMINGEPLSDAPAIQPQLIVRRSTTRFTERQPEAV